jgi:hypothetical protein
MLTPKSKKQDVVWQASRARKAQSRLDLKEHRPETYPIQMRNNE